MSTGEQHMHRSSALRAGPAPDLSARFGAPQMPRNCVSRPRLEKLLHAALDARLTVVGSAAGLGKSVLLTSWVTSLDDADCAWITLDARHNESASFWHDIDHAFAHFGVHRDRLLDVPHRSDAVLVLDDAHALTAAPARRTLAELVAMVPDWMHLVLATRERPDLPLWRLRAEGVLCEITDDDLRMTVDETAILLDAHGGYSPEEVVALWELAEGWVTGIRLLATSQLAHDPAQRAVREFLLDEVLDHQEPTLRQFLLETSCLLRLTPAVCTHVTGRDDAAEALRTLENAHAFITRVPGEYSTYRLHGLFRAMLYDELLARDPVRAEEVMRSAAQWRATRGDTAATFDPDGIAKLQRATGRLGRGGYSRRSAAHPSLLSKRELDVLQYLPTRLSAREIAQALYVSVNTVKTHMQNVYRKLGCDSREAAVEQARRLQLLP
jgi:LuxR family maltose regulon positive regulatory protein